MVGGHFWALMHVVLLTWFENLHVVLVESQDGFLLIFMHFELGNFQVQIQKQSEYNRHLVCTTTHRVILTYLIICIWFLWNHPMILFLILQLKLSFLQAQI